MYQQVVHRLKTTAVHLSSQHLTKTKFARMGIDSLKCFIFLIVFVGTDGKTSYFAKIMSLTLLV